MGGLGSAMAYSLLLVALGGALGSVMRYLSVLGVGRWLGTGFPYGTLAVNITGSFLMGLLVGWLARSGAATPTAHLFVAVGCLGGFTTFSAFSLDAVAMLQRGETVPALLYVIGSVMLSLMGLMVGLWCMRVAA